jgi:hypothetical protein
MFVPVASVIFCEFCDCIYFILSEFFDIIQSITAFHSLHKEYDVSLIASSTHPSSSLSRGKPLFANEALATVT